MCFAISLKPAGYTITKRQILLNTNDQILNKQYQKGQSAKVVSARTQFAFFSPVIQPKLTVNRPGDEYEQEADAKANEIMRISGNTGTSPFFKPAAARVQRKCHDCAEEEKLHRKEMGTEKIVPDNEFENYVASLDNKGEPLSEETRGFFEPRFGHDFSNVKVHTDSSAANSAEAINALAYTSGNNIVFNKGRYDPDTYTGKMMLSHELTHVVQQGKNVVRRYGHDNFCSEEKHLKPFIWPGHATALSMLKNTLEAFKKNDPALSAWIPKFFGKEGLKHINEIEANYKAIQNKINENYLYHCNGSDNKNDKAIKCRGQRAETDIGGLFPSFDITLCFDVINQSWSTTDMASLIIHENYHRAFGSSTHPWVTKGNPPDCSDNAGAEKSDLLLDNPDSYACMAIVFR